MDLRLLVLSAVSCNKSSVPASSTTACCYVRMVMIYANFLKQLTYLWIISIKFGSIKPMMILLTLTVEAPGKEGCNQFSSVVRGKRIASTSYHVGERPRYAPFLASWSAALEAAEPNKKTHMLNSKVHSSQLRHS